MGGVDRPMTMDDVRTVSVTLFVGMVVMLPFTIPAQAQTCTRDDLKAFVASYFKAVETHDLSALPTAPNLRITENGVETPRQLAATDLRLTSAMTSLPPARRGS